MRIAVIGIGYVGLATATLWAASHQVTALDVVPDKVDSVNQGRCPFADGLLQQKLSDLRRNGNNLTAAMNVPGALAGFDAVFIAAPTNYNEELQKFDTSILLDVLGSIAQECPEALVVIRSTVHPGFTDMVEQRFGLKNILFTPEFLREGKSMEDCLKPSRVVIGCNDAALSKRYRTLLEDVYAAQGVAVPPIVECSAKEAEAAKLFANTYLAARVAFFNELDSYALHEGLDAARIIKAISLDPRIGDYYNNPSFGFGGYCLPKDSQALLWSFGDEIPHDLVAGTVAANAARQRFIAEQILARNPTRVGVHRLTAKHGSDNLRSSALAGVVDELVAQGTSVLVYEPMLHSRSYHGAHVTDNLGELLKSCDIIIANRRSDDLASYEGVVFTRDLYTRD